MLDFVWGGWWEDRREEGGADTALKTNPHTSMWGTKKTL